MGSRYFRSINELVPNSGFTVLSLSTASLVPLFSIFVFPETLNQRFFNPFLLGNIVSPVIPSNLSQCRSTLKELYNSIDSIGWKINRERSEENVSNPQNLNTNIINRLQTWFIRKTNDSLLHNLCPSISQNVTSCQQEINETQLSVAAPAPLRNPGLGVTQDRKYNTHRKYTSGPILQKY